MDRLKIVIVDDHPVIRRGVRDILAENPLFEVVGEAASGLEALQRVRETRPDLVLLDVTLPDRTGIEVLKDIRDWFPQIKVLVLSIHSEEQYAVRALRAGAVGYITKESAPEDLLQAIEAVLEGDIFVTETIARKLTKLTTRHETPETPHELLSDREFEVLRLLGQGKGISQIAAELGVSVKTVSTYRARILEKLGKESTAELIRYAVEHNLT
ncbi:MAG: response regulator transcription factor [Candidatus Sumerlaeaceae bacterium]|nr:response regulator transcription factor [Candidatus Sumerlaeaceae bacterium]